MSFIYVVMLEIMTRTDKPFIKANDQPNAATVRQKQSNPHIQKPTARNLKTASVVDKTVGRSNRVADGTNSRSIENSVGNSSATRQTLLGDEVSGQTGDVGRGC